MKSSSEYRAAARAALSGKWLTSAMFFVCYVVISFFVNLLLNFIPVVGSVIATFAVLPVSYAVTVGFLRQYRGEEQQLGWLFQYFNKPVWVTQALVLVYTFLWTLLLIVPGIIKAYSYAMTPYLLNDNPDLEGNAAIEKSMAMMQGHKLDLFVLDITFIGWALLCLLTLGIGYFWLVPYMYTARASFYEDLKAQA